MRRYNAAIGSYEKSVYTTDFDYSVKLSNGRIRLPEELIDDYGNNPALITANRYQAAASRFLADEDQLAYVPVLEQSPIEPERRSSGGTWRIIIALLIIVLGYFWYQSQQKSEARANIYNEVSVHGGTYSVNRLLGGIKDLRLTVTNNSDYILDIVTVKISYIKADGGLYKDEVLYFNHLNAHSTMTLDAPDSDRGTSVTIGTPTISCAALNL